MELISVSFPEERIAEVKLIRPSALNAVNMQLASELIEGMQRVEANQKVKVVLVKGEGKSFCAGADLKEMGKGITPKQHFQKLLDLQEAGRIMRNSNKIFIGCVQGYAVGIGFEVALACDMLVAAENAVFRFPEVEIDATVTGGGHKLLLEAVGGMFKAKELLFLGKPVSAAEAMALGFVGRVAPLEQLDQAALELAYKLRDKPYSIGLAKKNLHVASESSMEALFQHEIVSALYSASIGERVEKAKAKMA